MKEFLFIILYGIIMWGVIEISIMLFRMTGLKRTVARYQVISMLTGTGYTTEESALIIDHPIRRKISAGLILFGYFSLAVMISSIASLLSQDISLQVLLSILVVLSVTFAALKTKVITARLQKKFKHDLNEQFNLEDWPLKDALSLKEDDIVSMLSVKDNSQFKNKRLCDLNLEEEGIQILLVKRGDYIIRKKPLEEPLQEGDRIMLFGNKECIMQKFPKQMKKDERE